MVVVVRNREACLVYGIVQARLRTGATQLGLLLGWCEGLGVPGLFGPVHHAIGLNLEALVGGHTHTHTSESVVRRNAAGLQWVRTLALSFSRSSGFCSGVGDSSSCNIIPTGTAASRVSMTNR